MKNLIYFNNIKDELILSNNLIKNIEKLNKINKDKIYELYNKELTKLKQQIKIDNDYLLFGITNHQKLLTIILLQICKKYKEDNKNIPHFIISDFESSYIINIIRQLHKAGIIEYSIININYYNTNINNILDDIKKLKKNNTILCIFSNVYNNSLYDLKKISSWCKYYNILTFNNIENQLYNEYNFSLSQDIIFLNFNKYGVNSKNINNYYLIIKKKILLNNNKSTFFSNIDDINKLIIQNNNILSHYLLNVLDINKYIFSNSIKEYHLLIINKLQESYKFIHFNDLIKSNNIKYYYNTPTIILLNNPKNIILMNYIAISIFIPNIKFTNNTLIDYFKNNNIILNNDNYKFYIDKSFKYFNDIKKGLIYIKITNNLKLFEITKFINVCNSFINTIFSLNIKSKKKKKTVKFSNPEYIVLTKPYKNTNKKKIKSILKK